jgi:hypothetical protein
LSSQPRQWRAPGVDFKHIRAPLRERDGLRPPGTRERQVESTLEVLLDVMQILDFGGPVRVRDFSIHISGVPSGAGWRDGIVIVRHIVDGRDGDECEVVDLTREEVVAEAGKIVTFVEAKGWSSPERLARAREYLRAALPATSWVRILRED